MRSRFQGPAPMRVLAMIGILLVLSGCLGPVSLQHAVIGYDRAVSQIMLEMLLLNIARLRNGLPAHFTVTSSIAATFDYRTSVGVGGIYNDTPGYFSPQFSLGVTAAENPTFSIIPMQGREFTERVLTPINEGKFEFFVFQGSPIDMVMRLMADGIEVQTRQGHFERFILNWPTHPREYEEFRRIALHLAWLNANRKLFVGRLSYVDITTAALSAPPSADEFRNAAEKGYHWHRVTDTGLYNLQHRVAGRLAITNYDPRTLSNEERAALNAKAAGNPGNFVLIDLRPGHPGGDWPLFGALKLRSFNQMLEFVAEGSGKVREYEVVKDGRTGKTDLNPALTLAIKVSESPPPEDLPNVLYRGRYYTLANTPWDRMVFGLLYQLFQVTVTDVSHVGVPITISK
jgi:hypothetical protein